MALMERVSALIRANLNDLIDQAEDPEKMLKQVMLDLLKKYKENGAKHAEWMRKAELAVDKKDDARASCRGSRRRSWTQSASGVRRRSTSSETASTTASRCSSARIGSINASNAPRRDYVSTLRNM